MSAHAHSHAPFAQNAHTHGENYHPAHAHHAFELSLTAPQAHAQSMTDGMIKMVSEERKPLISRSVSSTSSVFHKRYLDDEEDDSTLTNRSKRRRRMDENGVDSNQGVVDPRWTVDQGFPVENCWPDIWLVPCIYTSYIYNPINLSKKGI